MEVFKIGNKYKSKKGKTPRTLLKFSECKKYGYFKCETSNCDLYRWIPFKVFGAVNRTLEIELKNTELDNSLPS